MLDHITFSRSAATDSSMVDDDRDDAMLVALVLAGEREAFGPLLRRYTPSVLRLCQRLVGSLTEAQDVAQEAALLAFLGLQRLQEPTRFGAWLHAIAAHVARTVLRRRHVISLDALDEGTAQNASWLAALPTPEDVAAARDLHDAIIAALNDLSVVNREAVIGYYIDGYSYRELAMLLGVPISTIKGRLFFGRRQLRRVLQPLAADVLSLDRRPRIRKVKELPMAMSTLVEMHLTPPVRKMLRSTNRIVLLREVDAPLGLTIFVGVLSRKPVLV